MITVSIVSHGQQALISPLLEQLLPLSQVTQVIVTLNLPEEVSWQHPKLALINNRAPKGFGENHNQAFSVATEPFFCVMNPDIRLPNNPFPRLLEGLAPPSTALAAPLVITPNGDPEDSLRYFPTPIRLAKKVLFNERGDYPIESNPVEPDWAAGMFLLFKSEAFRKLEGFDESFFLYYEDVDICARIWKLNFKVIALPDVTVIHDAQRDSHRKFSYLKWHLGSMTRYFIKHLGRQKRST